MHAEFWQKRWSEGRLGFHQSHVNDLLRAYWPKLGCLPEQNVFVPLCGKSLDMLWLRQQGHPIVANDLIDTAAQDFFSEAQLAYQCQRKMSFTEYSSPEIRFWAGDYFALAPEWISPEGAPIGFYDRAALAAMPPGQQARYVEQLARLVPPRSRGLIIALEQDKALDVGPPFSLPAAHLDRLFSPYFEIQAWAREPIAGKSPQAWDCVYALERRSTEAPG